MRKVLVTFGGKGYDSYKGADGETHGIAATIRNKELAKLDEIYVYDDAWLLASDFYRINRWIFDRKPQEHLGHCCWKPYILMDTLRKLQPGDVMMYVDGDTHPIADLSPLFEMAARDKVVLFQATGCDNMRFTKAECFKVFGYEPHHGQHACGRFQLFTAWDWFSTQLLMEWQSYMLNPLCQFAEGSTTMADPPEFHRNSADQSVLSMLAIRYGIPLHREACQFGWPANPSIGQPGDNYPQLFHQEWATGPRDDVSGSRFRNV